MSKIPFNITSIEALEEVFNRLPWLTDKSLLPNCPEPNMYEITSNDMQIISENLHLFDISKLHPEILRLIYRTRYLNAINNYNNWKNNCEYSILHKAVLLYLEYSKILNYISDNILLPEEKEMIIEATAYIISGYNKEFLPKIFK